MKKINYILLSVVFIAISYMATAEKVALTQGGQSKLSFTQNDYSRLGFKSSVTSFDHFTVKTKDGDFVQITIPGYGQSVAEGYPQLPVMNRLIEVPDGAEISIKIVNNSYQEYALSEFGIENQIMPAQPPVSKSIDNPEDLPFVLNQEIYQTEGYIENDLAVVTYLGEMRGVQLARLEVAPVQYDPVLNRIKVYTELIVEVNFIGGNTAQTIQNKENTFSPYFESIYKMVSNYKEEVTDELIMDEPATYIIVSDPMFETALQPFIQWKTKKGFNVVEAYTNEPGVGSTTSSIKTYLQNFYNSPPTGYNSQSFVLIVGDVDQVPTFSGTAGSHVSDLYYFEYTGDLFPECYYGRFSANNVSELQPQIDKTLEYEQYLMPDPSYLDEVVMVAGADGGYETHSNGQINYGTNHYFNAAHGLYSHTYLQPEPSGGNYSANIQQNVSDGVSYANYTAHCSSNGWADPGFSISDVASMTNAHKYPLMVGNCCLSNTFNTNCFGEALLRAENKGAIGYIGGTNSTYWDEDYWWGVGFETVSLNAPYDSDHLGAYDGTFHDHGEAIDEWFIAQGQMTVAGNLAVTQSGSSRETYYWEIYHLMGDPSLMIYYSQPPVTTATYSGLMPTGTVSFTVNTEPYAYVAISKDGILYGAAIADGTGLAEISMDPITVPGTADVVVTRQNGQPYIGTVTVASPSGPYVLFDSFAIDDAAGNNNGQADYDELVSLDVTLENLGSSTATNVSAVISTTDTYILLVDNSSPWPDIPDGTTSAVAGAFTLQVVDNVPDQHVASFDVEITDGSEIWNSTFSLVLNAPLLQFGNVEIDDNIGGNGNGRLDPGETADVILPVENNGNSNSPMASASLSSVSSWITINTASSPMGTINAGVSTDAVFNITCDPLTPIGTPVDLIVNVAAGNYGINNTFYTPVGLVLEDWETGNFASFPWTFSGNADWIITDVDPYEGSYSAKSGTITHNQTSELIVDLYVSTPDDLSFYYKVSSESSYDYLRFYIDDVQQDQWSGDVAWSQVTYPVTAGAHTFKWEYSKDGSVSTGSDCAWIDYIIFPPIVPPPDPAEIALNPISFEVTLAPGSSTVEQLNIANLGEVGLDFNLIKLYLSKSNKAYCASVGGGGDEFIENVSIGTINNTSGQDYYVDYTAMSTMVNAGESYPITITNGDPIWSSDQCGIWVDWNQNEDFTDDGMITVSGSPGVGPYTANIVPPIDALPGPTRMRVQIIYAQSPDPCLSSFSYGEVEDYTLVVNSNFTDWLTLDPMTGTVAGSDNVNIDLTFDATDLELGDYFANVLVNSNDPVNPQVIVPCTLHVADNMFVTLKVFMEGPYSGPEMRTDLNEHNMIPNNQPYTGSPWNYNGTESVSGMPNTDVVDWVLVEFRDAPGNASTATSATTMEIQAAFLLKDGSIVGMDGSSDLMLNNTVNGNLFVVIHHRNHIAIMSADELPLSVNLYQYDFTDSELNVYGGSLGYKQIATGVWGMVSADGLCDGIINMDDKTTVWTNESGHSGYNSGDFDLDANVDNKDKANFWYQNMDYGTQFPDDNKTGFKSQVPK